MNISLSELIMVKVDHPWGDTYDGLYPHRESLVLNATAAFSLA